MKEKGLLTVLSGFAGSGKGSIMKKLVDRYPDLYALSVSATTRSPRPGEEDGREYFFRTEDEFEKMVENGELLEYARYVDHYYGTPRAFVERQLSLGKNVLLEIEVQGAMQVYEKFPDTLLLFTVPPSVDELVRRLSGRGSESSEEVRARLERAIAEADGSEAYDYLIINDDLDTCVETTHQIIQNEHNRMKYGCERIDAMKEELITIVKGETI